MDKTKDGRQESELVELRKLATAFREWLGPYGEIGCPDAACATAGHPGTCCARRVMESLANWEAMK